MVGAIPKKVVLIAGPTASGKSSLAMRLAKLLPGVIINADSMQVYSNLRVLTARPSIVDEQEVPHHLYGHVEGSVRYSVGAWIRDVATILDRVLESEKTPIIVGGTGLYFKALTEGLAQTPEIEPSTHDGFIAKMANESTLALHKRLESIDADTAIRVQPADRQRILRALMVAESTGQTLSEWQSTQHAAAILPGEQCCRRILIPGGRNWLYDRIETRFAMMIREGAAQEAQQLLDKDLSIDLPVMNAIGMPHYRKAFREGQDVNVIEKSVRDTRRYAKRQLTWFRNQFPDWIRLDPQQWSNQPASFEHDLNGIVKELKNGT